MKMTSQMVGCEVEDLGLAAAGQELIDRAAREMPALPSVRERVAKERPLLGLRPASGRRAPDAEVACPKLQAIGVRIDTPTDEQVRNLSSWGEGT